MKNILLSLLFLVITSTALLAQTTIKGIVKDKYSQEVITRATISSDDGQSVTISNDEGNFRLTLPEGSKSVTITYLGYSTISLTTAQATQQEVFLMEPKPLELDEVVILNIPVHEFLKKLIANSTARLTSPMVLSTYYREFVNLNNKYSKFADGLIDYKIMQIEAFLKNK